MRVKTVWLVARSGPRIDELARSARAALVLSHSCSVLLIKDELCHVFDLERASIASAVSEADVLQCIEDIVKTSVALPLSDAVTTLVKNSSGVVAFLDEAADEDWSWSAPNLEATTICLGVHEDFVDEVSAVRGAVETAVCRGAQLGPVALHSSACLHLLSAVRPGPPKTTFPAVRPVVVQAGCAPRAASARTFRRALPRRQPIRFILALPAPPLESAASMSEVHQAIVASCFVSKSVYDERDTRLTLVWPSLTGLRGLTVDRTLLTKLDARMTPAEAPVLNAVRMQLDAEEASFDDVFAGLVRDCERLAFAPPVFVRVVNGCLERWPEWAVQQGWPTDPPIFLFLRWPGELPVEEQSSIAIPNGTPACSLAVLQHWHTLGVLASSLTTRAEHRSRGVPELLEHVSSLVPQIGSDVKLDTLMRFKGTVLSRVRQGHVLFADCGTAKALCKDREIGLMHFQVLMHELHVGDILHCAGFPGFDFHGTPVLFVKEVFAIEPGKRGQDEHDETEIHRDEDFLVMLKPSGMLAHEDARHRHERGTALRVDAEHLVAAPDLEVSGPAIYTWRPAAALSVKSRKYLALVAGSPNSALCCIPLRPKQGQPKEDAETGVEILWRGQDCSLVSAEILGCERPSQVRKHLQMMGSPVWGDRRFGSTRANMRARGVYGLAKPWCHLSFLELRGNPGMRCECALPRDLLKVLRAVGCSLELPTASQITVSHHQNDRILNAPPHEQDLAIEIYKDIACMSRSQLMNCVLFDY